MQKILTALQKYTEKFYSTTNFEDSNVVASPLGSWLLVASISKGLNLESSPELKSSLEECLGLSIEEAATAVEELLAEFPSLNYVAKAWSAPNLAGLPAVKQWVEANTLIPHEGSIPPQSEIDEWVSKNTNDLIKKFPAQLDDSTLLIIANIIYSKLSWNTKFFPTSANEAMKNWGVEQVLSNTNATDDISFFKNSDGNIFAVFTVQASGEQEEAVLLFTCLSEDLKPFDLMKAIDALPTMDTILANDPLLKEVCQDMFRVKEVRQGFEPIRIEVNTPAWEVETAHSLLDNAGLGYQEIVSALMKEATAELAAEAKQVAAAKFDKDGFEAAALTTMLLCRSAAPVRMKQTVYELNFAKPFVFVSYTGKLPVFSGYISIAKEG